MLFYFMPTIIDVEFILEETEKPKESEMYG